MITAYYYIILLFIPTCSTLNLFSLDLSVKSFFGEITKFLENSLPMIYKSRFRG
jgi:hypothetical protein